MVLVGVGFDPRFSAFELAFCSQARASWRLEALASFRRPRRSRAPPSLPRKSRRSSEEFKTKCSRQTRLPWEGYDHGNTRLPRSSFCNRARQWPLRGAEKTFLVGGPPSARVGRSIVRLDHLEPRGEGRDGDRQSLLISGSRRARSAARGRGKAKPARRVRKRKAVSICFLADAVSGRLDAGGADLL